MGAWLGAGLAPSHRHLRCPGGRKPHAGSQRETFAADAVLRPASDILDALDLHYRLHWAVRQARLDNKPVPGGIEGGVVYERHYALNWLVRFEDAEWDAVETPT